MGIFFLPMIFSKTIEEAYSFFKFSTATFRPSNGGPPIEGYVVDEFGVPTFVALRPSDMELAGPPMPGTLEITPSMGGDPVVTPVIITPSPTIPGTGTFEPNKKITRGMI